MEVSGISTKFEVESPTMTENEYRWGNYERKRGDRLSGYTITPFFQDFEYPIVTSAGANAIRNQRDLAEAVERGKESR